MPPVIPMVQWVNPRHKISIRLYPTAPILNKVKNRFIVSPIFFRLVLTMKLKICALHSNWNAPLL